MKCERNMKFIFNDVSLFLPMHNSHTIGSIIYQETPNVFQYMSMTTLFLLIEVGEGEGGGGGGELSKIVCYYVEDT